MNNCDIDSPRLQVQTKTLEERRNRRFAGAVSGRPWQTTVSSQTRYCDQLTASPCDHLGNDSRYAIRGANDVDIDNLGNFVRAEICGISGRAYSGIGDKYINWAEALTKRIRCCGDG